MGRLLSSVSPLQRYLLACPLSKVSTNIKSTTYGPLLTGAYPLAAAALMGQSGAVAMLILLFLAVTSACSAEQIAVSSLLTYDVYGAYINKNPTEKQKLRSSQICIVGYSIFMGAIATAFNYIGVSMGYLYELMGVIIGCAVVPIAMCITWKKCNGTGAVVGAIVGFLAAIAGWVGITAKLNNGVINVETTFEDYSMLTGNLLSIGVGGIITIAWSLIKPEDFDWEVTRAINNRVDNHVEEVSPPVSSSSEVAASQPIPSTSEKTQCPATEGGDVKVSANATKVNEDLVAMEEQPSGEYLENVQLQKSFRFAAYAALTLVALLIFIIPLPLFFSSHGE